MDNLSRQLTICCIYQLTGWLKFEFAFEKVNDFKESLGRANLDFAKQ